MNTKVKLIKKEQPKAPAPVEAGSVNPNKLSRAVRGWINEFQKNRRHEDLPAFDSLFKNTP